MNALHAPEVDNRHEAASGLIAVSTAMRILCDQARRVAAIDIPVLCLGESGVGKEVIARLVHGSSNRAHRTFMKVNCAALPADLLESELFGYEAGAFTGALRSKPGKFELCNGGTMFLDEIAEMPVALQAKLLHVLQDREFSRLGGRSRVRVDVRIIAATNVNVTEAVASKAFRQDLYFRLSAVQFEIPPLRERREDIPALCEHFISLFSKECGVPPAPLSAELMTFCMGYDWPGNVRELQNFIKRHLILGEQASLAVAAENTTKANGRHAAAAEAGGGDGLKSTVRALKDGAERRAILDALEKTNWNRKHAAELLQISYKAILNKIRQHNLEPVRGREAQRPVR